MQVSEIQQEVLSRLDTLAAQLGVTASQMFEALVVKAEIMRFVAGGALLISGLLGVLAAVLFYKCDDHDNGGSFAFSGTVLAAMAVFCFIFGLISMETYISPEAYAFSKILSMLP